MTIERARELDRGTIVWVYPDPSRPHELIKAQTPAMFVQARNDRILVELAHHDTTVEVRPDFAYVASDRPAFSPDADDPPAKSARILELVRISRLPDQAHPLSR